MKISCKHKKLLQ